MLLGNIADQPVGPLCRLVYDLCAHQHIVEIYPKRPSAPSHTHNSTVCVRITVVSGPILSFNGIAFLKKKRPSS